MDKKRETKVFSSQIKAVNEKELVVEHFISTETEDRGNDIMLADGMYMRGVPAVLKQHGFDPDTGAEPIARPLEIRIGEHDGKKGLIAVTKYYDGSHLNPPDNTGRRLFEKARDGFMPYWSIGYNIDEYEPTKNGGRKVTKWELLEYSQVNVPMNPEAAMLTTKTQVDIDSLKPENVRFKFDVIAEEMKAYTCECIECGHKMEVDGHCKDTKCPKCGGTMRRAERPGPGQKDDAPEEGEIPPEGYKSIEDFYADTEVLPLVKMEGKPYPSEHACRLNDPDKYDKMRRKNGAREHDGKKYDVIYGHVKKTNKWEDQAFRYPKDKWEAAAARSHCKSHDGTFEAASKVKMIEFDEARSVTVVTFEDGSTKEFAVVEEEWVKTVKERIAGDIPAMALSRIFDAMMYELYKVDGANEKAVRAVWKEAMALMEPFAFQFATETSERQQLEEQTEVKDLYIRCGLLPSEAVPVGSQGGTKTGDVPPPVLRLVRASSEGKMRLPCSAEDLRKTIGAEVAAIVKDEFDKMRGRV